MAITAGTNITGIQIPEIGVESAPAWAQAINDSLGSSAIDGHDHTTNKGSRITPAAMNINSDLPLNSNDLTEIRTLSMDAVSGTGTGDVRAVYADSSGNLKYRNSSGVEIGITTGSSLAGTAGSIAGMTDSTPHAAASFAHGDDTYSFYHNQDSTVAKMSFSDFRLYKYVSGDGAASTAYVTIAVNSSASGSSGTLTVPLETATFLTTATSFAGTINVATSASNGPINLTPHGTGSVVISKVDINGGSIDACSLGTVHSAITEAQIDNVNINGSKIYLGDSTEFIEGDEDDLTLGSSRVIYLNAATDVRIPVDRGLIFGDGAEKIESDNTNLTIASGGAIKLNAPTEVVGAVTVGEDGTGHNVIFYGDTAGRYMEWDQGAVALSFKDNSFIRVGTGNDIQIYHNGTDSYIENATGILKIATETPGVAVQIGHTTSEVTVNDNLTVTGKLYSKGNCYQTNFNSSLVFGY